MSATIKTHGVTERFVPKSELDLHVEEIKRRGFSIVSGLFNHDELEHARESLNKLYREQAERIGGEDKLLLINDRNIVRSPLMDDQFFLKNMAAHERILAIAKAVLGEKISLFSQVGIINQTNVANYQEAWHRDLQYQHFTSSRPLGMQALVAVDEFTKDNGATVFLEGSHLFEEFPSDAYVKKHECQVTVPAGGAIVFDSMVYHRGAKNFTDKARIAVNNAYTIPLITQQISFASALTAEDADNQQYRELLGCEWAPAPDVDTWRQIRLQRQKKTVMS